ncbi:lysozyme family protein [Virgibacillus alimentarius]|uniref:CwlT-like lysozyme domain-containing protein n=1 Tax=Virgibacillus alimentarius TaxID=698769 RepID=A0ABS4S9I9_9BACI|nr:MULTISPECIES: lysozyme family protein [Virgibacillus]MBP2258175.1 hypothetical protein [Virgibacillus alimentarius]HLR66538.1 lysozyme family protein [Virgibacillus sp.]
MKRKTVKAMKKATVLFLFIGILFVVLSLLTYEKPEIDRQPDRRISDEVKKYQPLVEKYAKKYHVSSYIDVILAMMMQESGGKGNDPMQSSESYCGEVGCIDDPEHSIKQGVYYFSQVLEKADGDVKLAVQSYNFGKGFIDYVKNQSGEYSQQEAINFSKQMYDKDRETYTCYREEAKRYNACYGDIYYVRDVMAYRETL